MFSHPSKLDLIDTAHATRYTVVVHVLLIPEELACSGSSIGCAPGGNPLLENNIREHYHRLWTLVVDAIARAGTATVYDNSAPRVRASSRR